MAQSAQVMTVTPSAFRLAKKISVWRLTVLLLRGQAVVSSTFNYMPIEGRLCFTRN